MLFSIQSHCYYSGRPLFFPRGLRFEAAVSCGLVTSFAVSPFGGIFVGGTGSGDTVESEAFGGDAEAVTERVVDGGN